MNIHRPAILLALGTIQAVASARIEPPKTAAELGFGQGFPPSRVVDMTSWDKGDDCRWAFQHISEIVPTANVSRGTAVATELPRSPIDLSGLVFETDQGNVTVEELLNFTYTDGFLVMQDEAIVFEKYYNGMTPGTRHLLMSVSKSLTGTLAGLLVHDGRLLPDKKVTEYIPELRNSPGFAHTTVREVLDMTTAIVFSEDYADPQAEVTQHEQAVAWRGRTQLANDGLYAYAQTIQKADRDHGEVFHYASINTDVLAWLIQRTSGQRFNEFMSERIWQKLGADHDAQICVDYHGSPVANGGFCITLRDLGRFAQMMLDDGFYNGQQIVPSGWVDDCRLNGNNAAWKPTKYSKAWPDGCYRNQWYVTGDDHGSYFAVGVNGQSIWINPTTRVVIVKFSSTPVSADPEKQVPTWAGMDAIARHLGQETGGPR